MWIAGIGVLRLVTLVIATSLVFNAVTAPPAPFAAESGAADVTVGAHPGSLPAFGAAGSLLIQAQCGSPCRGVTPGLAEEWLRPLRQGAAEAALPRMAAAGVLYLGPEQLRAITVPRAVIWGERDLRSGGSLADARSNFGDPPTLVIPGAGHLSMVADPDTFTADLEQLVATMPAAR